MTDELRLLFFTMANLNIIDGSSIWMHSVAETLHVDPRTSTTILLRAPETRDVITRGLHRLARVELVDPRSLKHADPAGLTVPLAVDALHRLDEARPFDAVILRAYEVCLEAVRTGAFGGRLWSCYILEPERDVSDPAYLAGMTRIAEASRQVVCQSEEMRALLESVVPAVIGKTILIAPGIPEDTVARPDPGVVVPRMIYAGKFHRFYPVERMIGMLGRLRLDHPDLEFHVAGDKFHRPAGDTGYASELGRALSSTPGVIWHGGIGRDEVEALVAQGGIALSLWDFKHGPGMNNLVISTKLLDFCSVGLPVILNRTAAQEDVLGADYPLFVSRVEEAEPLLRRLLEDGDLYREASERTFAASRRYTYPSVYRHVAPYLDRLAVELHRTPARAAVDIIGADAADVADVLGPLARFDVRREGSSRDAVAVIRGALPGDAVPATTDGSSPRSIFRLAAMPAAGDDLRNAGRVVARDGALAAAAIEAGLPPERVTVIPQPIDDVQLLRPKLPGAMFNVAVAGLPDERRLALLVHLQAELRRLDERFRVVVRGASSPAGGPAASTGDGPPACDASLGWEPDDGDLPNWYRTVGFVAAVEPDAQQAVALAEATASGAIPILLGGVGTAGWLVGPDAALDPADAARTVVHLVRSGLDDAASEAAAIGSRAGIAAVRDAWIREIG